MIRARSNTLGVSTADVVVGIALVTVVLALAYPTLKARSFRASVAAMVLDVDALREGAEDYLRASGSWPAPEATGTIPPELTHLFPGDTDLAREQYTLQWSRWEVVDYVEAPPSVEETPVDAPPDTVGLAMMPVVREVGGIILHSSNASLLAELLLRYGTDASFVRDSTWTLLLPARGGW